MSNKHSVAAIFDTLIEQTQQRGGSPNVREISDAALAVDNLAALAAVEASTEIPGQPRPIYAAGHFVHQSTD